MGFYLGDEKKGKVIFDGYQEGYNAGYEKGKAEADTEEVYNEGFEDGKKAEYDEFWDNVLASNIWTCRFAGGGWTDDTFAPPRSIIPTGSASSMFQNSGIKNIKGICERLNITIDLSKTTSVSTFLADSCIEHFGVMDLRSVSSLNSGALFNATSLISVDRIILKDNGSQKLTNFANNCNKLVDIDFEGVIGQNGLDLHWSTKLSKASIESIINCLSANTSGLTVTLSLTAVKKAFETTSGANDGNTSEEWLNLIAPKSNWTITLA